MAYKTRKRKGKKAKVLEGVAHISSTFNNTLITITDTSGNCLTWAASGTLGIKGSKKSTPFAAGQAAEKAAKQAMSEYGMVKVSVRAKGLGSGKESAIRSLQAAGLEVTTIEDVTPIPHNGCRPSKRRRG
ncbi:MAG: 30S ribosomal protein S11 [bacterium]|nr:30S ribosomal protein S11 [bacterium]